MFFLSETTFSYYCIYMYKTHNFLSLCLPVSPLFDYLLYLPVSPLFDYLLYLPVSPLFDYLLYLPDCGFHLDILTLYSSFPWSTTER
jgi:hypothetical protein